MLRNGVKETMEEMESIYGEKLSLMNDVLEDVLNKIDIVREEMKEKHFGEDPVEHCLARIKSDESMREKCIRKGIPVNAESALAEIHDAIGIRVVCAFIDDVYEIRNYIVQLSDIKVIEEKDYIKHAKPNGYRSYHMIIQHSSGLYVEIQLRTISMDTWAALEHHLYYKKNIEANAKELIVSELKRCADELASTDVSMQTIRNMIYDE